MKPCINLKCPWYGVDEARVLDSECCGYRSGARRVVYVRVLDKMALIGEKDCEICYIKHVGRFEELCQMACERNIVFSSVSKKTV